MLRTLFERYRDDKGFSGAALIKRGKETVFSFAAGYANRMYKIENTLDMAFDTASITKLFTAAGIVLLESGGQISFDASIYDFVDLSGSEIPGNVTIKHLLTHTSGIADDAEESKGEDYSALFIDKPNYSIRENKDFLNNFIYKKPNFQPGKKICYNNCGFVLLGLAIEKITRINYRDFITNEIFRPFQMKNTFFASKEDSGRIFAEGYFYDENGALKKNIYSFPPVGTADSGAYTTVGDLDIFIRTVYNSPVYNKMLVPQTNIKKQYEDYQYTMGMAFELREKEGRIIRAHKDGCNAGVCNITVFYPKEAFTFSILGNVDCNIWELHREAEKLLFI